LNDIIQKITELYKISINDIRLKYKDNEDDLITISDDSEFNEAIQLSQLLNWNSLKLYVESINNNVLSSSTRSSSFLQPSYLSEPSTPLPFQFINIQTPQTSSIDNRSKPLDNNNVISNSQQLLNNQHPKQLFEQQTMQKSTNEEKTQNEQQRSFTNEQGKQHPSPNQDEKSFDYQASNDFPSHSATIELLHQLVFDRELLSQLPNGITTLIDSISNGDQLRVMIAKVLVAIPKSQQYPVLLKYTHKLTESPLSKCVESFITSVRNILKSIKNIEFVKIIILQQVLPQVISYSQNINSERLYEVIKNKLQFLRMMGHSSGNQSQSSLSQSNPFELFLLKNPIFAMLANNFNNTELSSHGNQQSNSQSYTSSSRPSTEFDLLSFLLGLPSAFATSSTPFQHSQNNVNKSSINTSQATTSSTSSNNMNNSSNNNESIPIHNGIECDECGQYPIRGIRYKCSKCINFDLCEKCESKKIHSTNHPLIKINTPLNYNSSSSVSSNKSNGNTFSSSTLTSINTTNNKNTDATTNATNTNTNTNT